MTREEILEYFKDINHAYNDCTRYDTLKRMIDELQELCEELDFVQPHKKVSVNLELCDDAISRQAVLDLAKFDGRENLGSIIHAFDVEQLPPVTPAEKVGRWITVDKGLIVTSYKCSECGRIERDDTGYDVTKDYPYCHCGAKMASQTRSERNDEE